MTNAELEEVICGLHRRIALTTAGTPLQDDLIKAVGALRIAVNRIAELEEEHNKTVTAIFGEEQLWWENRCKELEAARMELTAKCGRLEAQMPKEGEWIESEDLESAMKGKVVCSICGEPQFALELTNEFMRLKNQKTNYCPNCGARMRRSNDDEN